jgi:hypothetical protein
MTATKRSSRTGTASVRQRLLRSLRRLRAAGFPRTEQALDASGEGRLLLAPRDAAVGRGAGRCAGLVRPPRECRYPISKRQRPSTVPGRGRALARPPKPANDRPCALLFVRESERLGAADDRTSELLLLTSSTHSGADVRCRFDGRVLAGRYGCEHPCACGVGRGCKSRVRVRGWVRGRAGLPRRRQRTRSWRAGLDLKPPDAAGGARPLSDGGRCTSAFRAARYLLAAMGVFPRVVTR